MNDHVAVKLSADEVRGHMSAPAMRQGLASQMAGIDLREFAAAEETRFAVTREPGATYGLEGPTAPVAGSTRGGPEHRAEL